MDFPTSKPLPPIGTSREDDDKQDSDIISNNTDRSKVTGQDDDDDRSSLSRASSTRVDKPESRGPRIMQKFRSELSTDDDDEDTEDDTKRVFRSVSFSEARDNVRSPALKETTRRKAYDGREVTFVSLDTQTDWDWVIDMEEKGLTRPASVRGGEGIADENVTTMGTKAKSEMSQPESQFDDRTVSGTTPFTQPYNDEFGIPLLELSSDTDDSSDDEASSRKTKDDRDFIPSVGPPQILQYLRESEKKDIDVEDPEARLPPVDEDDDLPKDSHGLTHGILTGDCEFCSSPVKPFPSLDQQLHVPPEQLYCCSQYREFVEFVINSTEEMEAEENKKKKLIDIKPHEHHGSKQERNAAKEKAVQRMRQRELDRRALEATGMQQNNFFACTNFFNKHGNKRPWTASVGVPVVKYNSRTRQSPHNVRDSLEANNNKTGQQFADTVPPVVIIPVKNYIDINPYNIRSAQIQISCVLNCSAFECPSCNQHWVLLRPETIVEHEIEYDDIPINSPPSNCHKHTEKCRAFQTVVKNYHRVTLGLARSVARQMKTINYQLSSQKCMEEGWTLRVPSPLSDDLGDDVFTPEPLNPAMIADGKLRDRHLIEKFYEDGQKFLTLFPDGTGNVFYPSGNLAILISSVKLGQYSYTIHEDIPRSVIIASFDCNGHGYCYFPNGSLRMYLDAYGGIELNVNGGRRRRWQWKDNVTHVHAPPFQPICISLGMSRTLGLRVMTQENISLTFSAHCRSCRFNMGSRLKLVAPENLPVKEIEEDFIFLEEKKNHVEALLNKVATLLKFPNSPKIDKILPPLHITHNIEKTEKLKKERKSILAAQAAKDKKMSSISAV